MAKITYNDKVALITNPDIANENKVTDNDMNEIKQVVNENDDKFLTNGLNVSNEIDEDYRVNLLHSKNLFDKDNCLLGKVWNGSSNTKRAYGYIIAKPNQTYTISCQNTNSDLRLGVVETIIVGSSVSPINQYDLTTSITFTASANTKYIAIQFSTTTNDVTQSIIDNAKVQINEGSEALPYEPYITPSIYVDNEEIYSKEDTDIVDITSKITLASNWSIDSGKIYKQGKHIFGTIQIKTPSSLPASTNSQNVLRIPYTLANSYIMGGFTTSGDKWAITNGFAYVYISSNGYATIVNSSTATFFRLQIDVMEA